MNRVFFFGLDANDVAVFALFGFLSPSKRGSLGTTMLLLYTILGFVGGYVSARCYKTFGGDAWKRNIALTPIVVPGIIFAVFFFLNFFLIANQSSGAVPFGTMLAVIAIWFMISIPLSVVGSWAGFKQPVSNCPTLKSVSDSVIRPSQVQSEQIKFLDKSPRVLVIFVHCHPC